MNYDSKDFWLQNFVIASGCSDKLSTKITSSAPQLTKFLQNDTNAFSAWRAFFSAPARPNRALFDWLLSLRPDISHIKCPFPIVINNRRTFTGCTLLQMMLLLKPRKVYFEPLSHLLAVNDDAGNSPLFYAALSVNFALFKRIWTMTKADGLSAHLPGPQTSLILVQADWTGLLKRDILVQHVISVLGGVDATITACIKYNSYIFAKKLLMKGADDFDRHFQQIMTQPDIDFQTFTSLLELDEKLSTRTSPQDLLKRAYSLCQIQGQHINFLFFASHVKKVFALSDSYDSLLAFTGFTLKMFRIAYCCSNRLVSILWVKPDVFDLNLDFTVSYLHFYCQAIATDASKDNLTTINTQYLPRLMALTSAKHWQMRDSQGKLPIDYLQPVLTLLDQDLVQQMTQYTAPVKCLDKSN